MAERDYVGELVRWQNAGATWEIVAETARGVTIALLRCDGGEEVDRFTSADPQLLAFIAPRRQPPASGTGPAHCHG